jgi:hypothetical protein
MNYYYNLLEKVHFKKDLKVACAAHGSNLEAYDPFAWIDVDGETRLRCISVKRRSQLL